MILFSASRYRAFGTKVDESPASEAVKQPAGILVHDCHPLLGVAEVDLRWTSGFPR